MGDLGAFELLPCGEQAYETGVPRVAARGYCYCQDDVTDAVERRLPPLLRDDLGLERLTSLLASVADTEFERDGVTRILTPHSTLSSWRVGEALAEAYLTDHRDCEFPWPGGRDLKNPNASQAGTDLVGFTGIGTGEYRFAFGEVKTSSQQQWPPSVLMGRHGLQQQLENLSVTPDVKDDLVKYLGHHASSSDWHKRYEAATKRYLTDPGDVSLFGMLVRDVDPRPDDLRVRAANLGKTCPDSTSIELVAVYLPSGTIDTLPTRAAEALRSES